MGQHTLAGHFPTIREGHPVVGHLFGVPARSDSQEKTPPRQIVEASGLFGEVDGIVLGHEHNSRAEAHPLGYRGRSSQTDKGIEEVAVIFRKLTTQREGDSPD